MEMYGENLFEDISVTVILWCTCFKLLQVKKELTKHESVSNLSSVEDLCLLVYDGV